MQLSKREGNVMAEKAAGGWSKRRWWVWLSLALLGIGVVGVYAGNWLYLRFNPPWPTAVTRHEVAAATANLSLLWMREDVYVVRSEAGIELFTDGQDVFLLGSTSPYRPETLVKLDGGTGETVWGDKTRFFWLPPPNLLSGDGERIFVGYEGWQRLDPEVDKVFGAGRVSAYNAETGRRLWTQTIAGAREIITMNVDGDALSVNGSTSDRYYQLERATGAVRQMEMKDSGVGYTLFTRDNRLYTRDTARSLRVADVATNERLWGREFPLDCLYQPPYAAGEVMLVRTGDGRQSGLLYGLDLGDGAVLWQYELARTVTSNVATSDGTAYFLNARAELVAMDAATGVVREGVQFVPAALSDAANRSFQVAAAGNLVLVYFGDSRQLFAFRVGDG